MDSNGSATSGTMAMEVMMAVVGDSPQDARRVLTGASFRDIALIQAWSEEMARLVRQGKMDYERRERNAWRDKRDRDTGVYGDGF